MFEFKEGDYIVWNKLSPWQQNYLAETLLLKEEVINRIHEGMEDGLIFRTYWFGDNQKSFCSRAHFDYYCQRELSFNEIYSEEDDTCPANKHPLWVTFDAEQDWDESCNLIDGKDYKVLEVTHGGDCYTVLDESGYERSYNKRFFDKPVSIASCKKSSTPCEEDERGFEGLGYVPPYTDNPEITDFYLCYSKLSEYQKGFLFDALKLDWNRVSERDNIFMRDSNTEVWWTNDKRVVDEDCLELSFNDIYQLFEEV